MELYIYDKDIELVRVIDAFKSLRWRRKFYEPGEFELHLPATKENINALQPGNYVHRLDRIESGLITAVSIGELLTVKGRMLSYILYDAVISQTRYFNQRTESAMLQIAAIAQRMHHNLKIAPAKGYSEWLECQISYRNVMDTLTKLSRSTNLGYRVVLDVPNKELVFEIYAGAFREVDNISGNPHVIFDDEFGNLSNPEYVFDISEFKNYAYVYGEGEGAERRVGIVDLTGGFAPRREHAVDAKSIRWEEGMTSYEYDVTLYQKGYEELMARVPIEYFEGDGVNIANFAYLEDWDLGDSITVGSKKWDIYLTRKITEVEEIYENGKKFIPVFGEAYPEQLDLGG